MKAKKKIIAVGGGGFTHNEDSDLDQFFLDQISEEKCSIGFLPTASNDDSKKTELFIKDLKILTLEFLISILSPELRVLKTGFQI